MDWLHRSMATAIPEDILVFFTQHWLPNHAGSPTPSGRLIAAPTAGAKSRLAKEYDLQGRVGDWDPASQLGNPMHSMQIRDMIKGYHNQAAELGYQKRGAVPLEDTEMLQLLEHMCSDLTAAPLQEQLLLVRDGLVFSLLWQTCFRGFNAGGVRLDNLVLPTGGSALPYLLPQLGMKTGAKLHLKPDHTKNKKGGHCQITVTCDPLCFTSWLRPAVALYASAGRPITNFLTRPLDKGTQVNAEKGLTSNAIWARLTKYLKAYGMYTGQSVHSTRRGSMIHQKNQMQATVSEVAQAAMCSERIAEYYTDVHRPTRLKSLLA
ncbi:hypothetical protein WJX77_008863 [Trebouxia sp. C0004]